MKMAIIGQGRLGTLLTNNLSKDFDISVIEPDTKKVISPRVQRISTSDLSEFPVIILALPINKIDSFCKEISPILSPDTLVIDTCSVKEHPLQIMKKELNENIQILGTHPMFGPDSAKKTLWGSKIVLCPERIENSKLDNIKSYLETHGLKVIISDAKTHDDEISQSLALTHFIGRALIEYGSKDLEIDTKGYRRLMKILETVENDTIELFKDMNFYNKHTKNVRKKFINILTQINDDLEREEA